MAIEQFALRKQLTPSPETLDVVQSEHLHVKDRANRAFLGALPRGSKLPSLLTDFLEEIVVPMTDYACLLHAKPGSRLPDNQHFPIMRSTLERLE